MAASCAPISGAGQRRRAKVSLPTGLTLFVLAIVVLVSGCSGGSKDQASVNISVFHLKPGECIVPPTDVKAQLSTVKVVSCRQPHTQEVYALVHDRGGDNYPGTNQLETFANGNCLQSYQRYVGVAYQHSSLFFTYLLPSVRSWAANDRTIVCVITTTGQKLTRSVKGSKR